MACLGSTWKKLRRKAFRGKSLSSQMDTSASGNAMNRVLGPVDITFLGIGGIIGAGVFVLTGVAAREEAGPAVVLSYLIASLAAVLSALCYIEFAVDMPVAGGAFVYINFVFGEFIGWVGASNLLLEYTLSSAAVARSFTSYSGALINGDADALRIKTGSELFLVDVPALLIIIALSALLSRGTQGGARFNTAVTLVNLAVIVFVFVAGVPHFTAANFSPFLPLGLRGAFSGASKVYFSFLGFDTLASAAEETKRPARDLPIGIVASLLICASLYAAMCVTIVGMVHWSEIDTDAPFAAAFDAVGMPWAGQVVAAGALAGIMTSLLVNLYGEVRLWMTLGRERLLPERLARVNEQTGTPTLSTVVTAVTAGAFALFVDLEALADLVSVGALTVFFLVSLACLWRRYIPVGEAPPSAAAASLAAMVAASIGFATSFALGAHWLSLAFVGAWLAAVVAIACQPVVWRGAQFQVPLSPLVPSLAVLANVLLISSLGSAAYVRFAIWWVLALALYLCYGVHHTIEAAVDVELSSMPALARSGSGQGVYGEELGDSDASPAFSSARLKGTTASPRARDSAGSAHAQNSMCGVLGPGDPLDES